ncbi:MAG: tyrosine-type recombinase/integrase [Desulfomonilaceae bacterium]
MAVRRRGDKYHIRFRHEKKEIWVTTSATLKRDAQAIELAVKRAIRTRDFSNLDMESRVVCIRLFQNRNCGIPAALLDTGLGHSIGSVIKEELLLWKAIELCLKYPEVKASPNRERHIAAFANIVDKFGKNFPVKNIWIPQIKEYQIHRLDQGAKPSTINKEKAALSKMFQVLVELQYVDVNPARQVKDLSEKTSERQIYISYKDYCHIIDLVPTWLRPIIQTAYYTGMRRGEIMNLKGGDVDLSRRIIRIEAAMTKERQWKRVPIHRDLVYILQEVVKVRSLATSKIFLLDGRPVSPDSIRKPWIEAVTKIGLSPAPTFHGLRHTWKTNARRSGMDPDIREAIMGHGDRARSVSERYGRISDQELIRAINLMTFDHGETEIWVSSPK